MNWDDLRILEAVRDERSFARASTVLRIDETTVGRRIIRLQQALGYKLFDLVDGERRPTAECEAAINHIRAMAGHAAEIADLGSRVGDGGAQGFLDRHRRAGLLLRPPEPLAAWNEREHESSPPPVLPERHRPLLVLASRPEPDCS